MVIVIHFSQLIGNGSAVDGPTLPFLARILDSGARGVQLFFLISAFTLFNSLQRYDSDRIFIKFYKRRAIRILPLYYFLLICFIFSNEYSLKQVLSSLTFTFGFIRFLDGFEIVPLTWSLFIEETFYLFLPAIFLFLKKGNPIKKLMILFFISLIVSYLWQFLATNFNIPNNNAFVFLFPLNHYFYFFIGIGLFYIKKMNTVIPHRTLNLLFFISLPTIFYGHRISSVALTFLFLGAANPKTVISKILDNDFLRSCGKLCFSLYLIHFPLMNLMQPYIFNISQNFSVLRIFEIRLLILTPIFILIAFLISKLTYNFIELPPLKWSKSKISR